MICIVWHGFYTSRCTLREKQHHCYSYLKTRQRCYAYLKTTALLRIPQNDSTIPQIATHTSNCYAYLKLLRIPQTTAMQTSKLLRIPQMLLRIPQVLRIPQMLRIPQTAMHTSKLLRMIPQNCYAYLKIATHTSKLLRIPQMLGIPQMIRIPQMLLLCVPSNCYAYLKIATHTLKLLRVP